MQIFLLLTVLDGQQFATNSKRGGGRGNTKKLFRNNQNKERVLMQTTVAKGVAMSKFCSDLNKNAIFFIFMKV